MGMNRKQVLLRQKARFEQVLKNRMTYLSGKGVVPPKTDKDTLVRKNKADIKAVNNRLRILEENEKRIEAIAKAKAEKAAARSKEKEGGKAEKPKKAQEGGKEKKPKAEKKAAPPKTAE